MRHTFLPFAIALLAAGSQTRADYFPSPTLKIEADDGRGVVSGYISSDNGGNRMKPVVIEFETNTSERVDGLFTLKPDERKQKIDGFGFAITGSTSYNLLKMEKEARHSFLKQVFSPEDGYGCSYVRIPIGASDFSLSQYTCCDKEGIENFALTSEETDYIIPVMKEIMAINPDVKVISAPWTAPRWMKTNGWWTDGTLKPECYDDYALYFVKWIKAFGDNGIPVYGVTPQNEPLNRGNSASMYMDWSDATNFIKKALGPKFEQNGIKTKIYVFDHNYNYDGIASQNHYPTQIYKDASASRYVAGAAFHNYGGDASEMTYIHERYPDKELIFTEWTAGSWSWPGVGMEAITTDASKLIFDVLNNWGQATVVWNLLLDNEHGPYRPGGASTANGAVDINKDGYSLLTYNSFYYVICTAAAAVSREAVRIGVSGSANEVDCVAFDNGDGYGMIMMNKAGSARKVRINTGNGTFVANIPPKSLVSYRW